MKKERKTTQTNTIIEMHTQEQKSPKGYFAIHAHMIIKTKQRPLKKISLHKNLTLNVQLQAKDDNTPSSPYINSPKPSNYATRQSLPGASLLINPQVHKISSQFRM